MSILTHELPMFVFLCLAPFHSIPGLRYAYPGLHALHPFRVLYWASHLLSALSKIRLHQCFFQRFSLLKHLLDCQFRFVGLLYKGGEMLLKLEWRN